MALSSSEHSLLVSTCNNMNIAANSCREVLEMLRSLGNTGVVDISDHNNAQGRHASDKTIVHAATDPNDSNVDTIPFGSKLAEIPKTPILFRAASDKAALELHVPTLGTSSETNNDAIMFFYNYLTDNEGSRVTFANDDSGRTYCNLLNLSARLVDAEEKTVAAAICLMQGKLAEWDDDNDSNLYGSIKFKVAKGSANQTAEILEISSGGLIPCARNAVSLGNSYYDFSDIFVRNSPTVTSDIRSKTDIEALDAESLSFIKSLRPVGYKFVQKTGHLPVTDLDGNAVFEGDEQAGVRTHWGFIAQEVKTAMTQAGIKDAAVWCLADKNDPDSKQMLRYEELIAPLVKAVQILTAKVEALERRVA